MVKLGSIQNPWHGHHLEDENAPSPYQVQDVREWGLVYSEYRVLLAEVEEFLDKLVELDRLPENLDQADKLITHYTHFSAQLELHQTAVLAEFSGNYKNYKIDDFNYLIDAVRTFCEEGILRANSTDPWEPKLIIQQITRELRGAKDRFETDHLNYRSVPQNLKVMEYDPTRNPPSSELLVQLSKISKELVIDKSRNEPQEGFGRVVSRAELKADIEFPGTRLFVPGLAGRPAGFYILSKAKRAMPKAAATLIKTALEELDIKNSNFPDSGDGWVSIIALSKEARAEFLKSGVHGYRAMTQAVIESACGLGMRRVWCEVRRGKQANLARAKHIALGWIPTDLIYEHDGHPYEILLLEPFAMRFSGDKSKSGGREYDISKLPADSRYYTPTGWLSKLTAWAPKIHEYATHGKVSSSPLPDLIKVGKKLQKLLEKEDEIFRPRIVRGCIEIPFTARDKYYALKQKIPNADLWKVEYANIDYGPKKSGIIVYYEKGLGKPLQPVMELLDGGIRKLLD